MPPLVLDPRPATPLTEEQASRLVSDIGIPPCPAVLTDMLKETRRDEPDFNLIGRLVARDIGLSATLLKTVNSPFYGLQRKVTSVQQATMFLGLRQVTNLVTGLLLRQAFSVARGDVTTMLWDGASRSAATLAWLAREVGFADADEAYTFGLFRDCGMLLLGRKYPAYDRLVLEHGLTHGSPLVRAEAALFPVGHASVGFHMAKSWYLPEELAWAVRHHHDGTVLAAATQPAERRRAALVALGLVADALTRALADGADPSADAEAKAAFDFLGLAPSDAPTLVDGLAHALAADDEEDDP